MKVYTLVYQPFMMGGNLHEPVATEVEEYGRILLPGGFAAIIVENPVKKLFHLFLEGCGALIKTGPDKEKIVLEAQVDAVEGDPLIMKKQIEQGMRDRDGARVVPPEEFFAKFKGEDREEKKKCATPRKRSAERRSKSRTTSATTPRR